jgi:TnsA endonuclease N terminal.
MDKSHIGIKSHQKGRRGHNYYQGHFEKYFKPEKYDGEYPIIFRSKLEFKYMISLERNPNVEKWSSEKIVIPYVIPEKINGKVVLKQHRYFTDFIVQMKSGKICVIEIKPLAQSPRTKDSIKNSSDIRKNAYKWHHAIKFCEEKGWEFKVITEEYIK